MSPEIDLTVPSIAALGERSEKWSLHGAGVLSATIAEMDFPLAEPVAEALRAAIARHDVGYATPAPASLRRSFAAFAVRRLAWTVDEEQVVLIADVIVGLIELCRAIVSAGDAVAFATPAYPPFFTELPLAAVRLVEIGTPATPRSTSTASTRRSTTGSPRSCSPTPTTPPVASCRSTSSLRSRNAVPSATSGCWPMRSTLR